MNRRHFLSALGLAGLGCTSYAQSSKSGSSKDREIAVFSKSLEKLPFDDLATLIAELKIDGIEAPLRKRGHIEPEMMAEKLPSLVAALQKQQQKVVIMASSINEVDKAGLTEKQLRAAAASGIKKYRLAYLKYDLKKPLKPQIKNFTAQLKDLAALNKEIGIQGLYQNHRGSNYVGAPVLDMVQILEEIDNPHLGMAFDFAHATVEGSNAWHMNLLRALPHLGAVYMKDFKVVGKKWIACPLGDGMVNPKAGKLITDLIPKEVPISLHVEYAKGKPQGEFMGAIQKDIKTLKSWL